ncbi:hypothetical protein [Intestinibacter sp.]|uniref:hypothetical protein n=1 Tax=Intestinibacter sp. TaxID=1965304 RepID=UPI003F191DF5
MSFFTFTTNDVTQALEETIKNFDSTVSSIVDLLTFNPKTGIWVRFWELSDKISITISAVAVCIAVIYAYLAIIKEGLTLKGDFKKIITILLRLCITKGLIDYSTSFMYWIYSFGVKITKLTNDGIGELDGDNLSSLFTDAAKQQYLAGLGLDGTPNSFECFIGYIETKFFFGIFFWGLAIMLMIISIARIFKIYIIAMFSGIALAKIPFYGFEGIKEYIKNILGLSLQGAIMIGAIALYKYCIVNNAEDISGFYTDGIFGMFGVIAILSICLILIIAKSETIAKMLV